MYYHYVFNTYKRKYVLTDKKIIKALHSYFFEIAKEKKFEIIEVSIVGDHVHILVRQTKNDTTKYIMKVIKGRSSRRFFKAFPSNRFIYRKLWARSYYAKKINSEDLKNKREYIKNQFVFGIDKRLRSGNREVYSQVPASSI